MGIGYNFTIDYWIFCQLFFIDKVNFTSKNKFNFDPLG